MNWLGLELCEREEVTIVVPVVFKRSGETAPSYRKKSRSHIICCRASICSHGQQGALQRHLGLVNVVPSTGRDPVSYTTGSGDLCGWTAERLTRILPPIALN